MEARFSQRVARLSDFQLHGIRRSGSGRVAVVGFTVAGQLALPSRSFWQWLFDQFSEVAQIEDEAEFFDCLRNEMPNTYVDYGLVWDDDGHALLTAPRLPHKRESANRCSRTRHVPGGDQLFMASPAGTIRHSLN